MRGSVQHWKTAGTFQDVVDREHPRTAPHRMPRDADFRRRVHRQKLQWRVDLSSGRGDQREKREVDLPGIARPDTGVAQERKLRSGAATRRSQSEPGPPLPGAPRIAVRFADYEICHLEKNPRSSPDINPRTETPARQDAAARGRNGRFCSICGDNHLEKLTSPAISADLPHRQHFRTFTSSFSTTVPIMAPAGTAAEKPRQTNSCRTSLDKVRVNTGEPSEAWDFFCWGIQQAPSKRRRSFPAWHQSGAVRKASPPK